MSTSSLPDFPGTDVVITRTTQFKTTTFETVSGKEQRVSWTSDPRHTYELKFNCLRENVYLTTGSFSGSSEIGAFCSLFGNMTGSFDTFVITDPVTATTASVRFVDDSLTITRIVPGVWEANLRAITVK